MSVITKEKVAHEHEKMVKVDLPYDKAQLQPKFPKTTLLAF